MRRILTLDNEQLTTDSLEWLQDDMAREFADRLGYDGYTGKDGHRKLTKGTVLRDYSKNPLPIE